jgi:hypothetical protein
MKDMKEGRFKFGRQLRGKRRKKFERDYTLPEMTFYCPLLRLRSMKPVCHILKNRPKAAEADLWELFTMPPECEQCDGRPKDYRTTDYSLAKPYDGFDIRVYKRMLVEVLCGVRHKRDLRRYRDAHDMDAATVEEALGFSRGLLTHIEETGRQVSLSTVLGLPESLRAVPTGDPSEPYRIEPAPLWRKKHV